MNLNDFMPIVEFRIKELDHGVTFTYGDNVLQAYYDPVFGDFRTRWVGSNFTLKLTDLRNYEGEFTNNLLDAVFDT